MGEVAEDAERAAEREREEPEVIDVEAVEIIDETELAAVTSMEVEVRAAQAEPLVAAHALPSVREFEAALAIAERMANSRTFVPEAYRGKPDDVLAAILAGREIGIGPMQSLRDIVMIDGRPTFSAHLTLALLRRGGVEIIESKSTREEAVITARRRDTGEIATVEWTFAEASQITQRGKRMIDKDNWKNYPGDMLWARCVGRLARRLGSDLIAGMPYTKEEVEDFDADEGPYPSMPEPEQRTTTLGKAYVDRMAGAPIAPDDVSGLWKWAVPGVDLRETWTRILTAYYGAEYDAIGKLPGDDGRQAVIRFSNVAARLRVKIEGGDFPPPGEDEIGPTIAAEWDGILVAVAYLPVEEPAAAGAPESDAEAPGGSESPGGGDVPEEGSGGGSRGGSTSDG